MISSYDDMGPRVDLGNEPPSQQPPAGQWNPSPPKTPSQTHFSPPKPAKSGSGALGVVSLLVALLALVVAIWGFFSQPEMIPPPPVSSSVVPGATAERVAKLEKDVGDLMLRMVTLEKEIKAVGSKTGSVAKLSELSNRVAGLQDRLDALSVDRKIAGMEKKSTPAPAKAAPAKQEPKAQAPAKEPARKKQVYTVRRGDTLFTIAQRYKVSMRNLKEWNKLSGNMVMIGQKLVIYK